MALTYHHLQHFHHPETHLVTNRCLWMQTLPAVAQVNILAFLSSEHNMFLAKDLELLALEILSVTQLDFWIRHGAEVLLSTVGSCSSSAEVKEVVPLPSFLCQREAHRSPVCPWLLPSRPPPSNKFQNEMAQEQKVHFDGVCSQEMKNVIDDEESASRKPGNGEAMQDEHQIIELGTPPCVEKGRTYVLEDQAVCMLASDEANIIDASSGLEDARILSQSAGRHDNELKRLAQSLRDAWLERRPTLDDLENSQALTNLTEFLNVLMPWTMEDDFVHSAIENFVSKDTGYTWSAQIIGFFLLPKLLQLERPASRFLVSAVMQAVGVHTRAAVDAVLLPLVLIHKGLNDAQSDVLNRAIKECMADHHLVSFCEKVLIESKRHQLPDITPSKGLRVQRCIWSEPFCSVMQNLLSRMASMDEELLKVLIAACNEEVRRLSRSLKFSNLLLCLISKFGSQLKPHQVTLERIAHKTQTFMTKSLLTKLSLL